MTNIADNILALEATVEALPDTLIAAIKAQPAPTVDESAVLAAIAALNTKLDTILGDLVPTPPTPDVAPAQ